MGYRPTLYQRLILALVVPVLVAMAAAWWIGVTVVSRAFQARVETQTQAAVRTLAVAGLPFTPELLQRVALLQQADFALLDRDGHVVFSTSSEVATALAEPLERLIGRSPSGATSFRLGTPRNSVVAYQPIAVAQDPRYSALVAVAPLAAAEAAARRAAFWLGLAMLVAAALLAALLLLLVRNMTRPLQQLAAQADRIAAGERHERLQLPRADEIGALADALNSMMERLGSYEARLSSGSRLAALGEMSARLAHEVRNPLTGLKLHLQLLAERVEAGESARVQQLLTEVQRLELLVSSTLVLGADQSRRPQPTDLGALVKEVADLMGPSLVHRGIRVESHLEDLPPVGADRARLQQALLNLVVNAADAMPQGGRLSIGVARDAAGDRVLVSVEDSGPGVPADMRAGVLTAAVSSKPFGLGLGLAVCRDVAAAHGGELRIESSAALGGARFVMALPLSAAPIAAAADE